MRLSRLLIQTVGASSLSDPCVVVFVVVGGGGIQCRLLDWTRVADCDRRKSHLRTGHDVHRDADRVGEVLP